MATYDDQDRLTTWGDLSFEFDDNGSLATRSGPSGTTTYGYDAHGAFTAAVTPPLVVTRTRFGRIGSMPDSGP